MIVDANDPDKVRLLLERELDNMMVRHDQAAGLYEKAASYAPSFGMIGTRAETCVFKFLSYFAEFIYGLRNFQS